MTDGEIIERAEEVFALYGGDDVTQADLDRMNRLLRIGAKVVAADEATVERAARAICCGEACKMRGNYFEATAGGAGVCESCTFHADARAALASVGE